MAYYRIGKQGKRYWGKKGAGIFFTDGASVLLLKRAEKGDNHGKWGLPGGKAETGESAIGTAIRETKEECGNLEGQRFDKSEEVDGRHHWTTFFYKIQKPFSCRLSDEHDDWAWVPLDRLEDLPLHPKFKENMDRYLRIVEKKFNGITFKEWLEDC